jgi:hypothetical protein
MKILLALPLAAVFAAGAGAVAPSSAGAAGTLAPPLYKNCTNLNKKYVHGIGRVNAVDRTSGTRVTTFKRSNTLYATAMKYNKGLDRDKDGIACEKR